MSDRLIPLSQEHQTILSMAARAFSEQQLREEIALALTWAPPLRPGELVYSVPSKALSPSAWNALLELEEWGFACRSNTPEREEILLADKSIFRLVIEAIRALLETLLQLLGGQGLEPAISGRQPAQPCGQRRPHQRADTDTPVLG